MEEDWTDGDKLVCAACDRFVSSLDKNGLCPECSGSYDEGGEDEEY